MSYFRVPWHKLNWALLHQPLEPCRLSTAPSVPPLSRFTLGMQTPNKRLLERMNPCRVYFRSNPLLNPIPYLPDTEPSVSPFQSMPLQSYTRYLLTTLPTRPYSLERLVHRVRDIIHVALMEPKCFVKVIHPSSPHRQATGLVT